jgi:lipocalin
MKDKHKINVEEKCRTTHREILKRIDDEMYHNDNNGISG